jgi:hypothetical protein
MNAYILRVLVYVIFQVKTFPSSLVHWVRIKIFKEHKRYELKTAWAENLEGKYAIFAIYPGTTTIQSCLRILGSLNENGFTVLVIVNRNKNSREWIGVFEREKCVLVDRPNLGRDFGAYQAGLRLLNQNTNLPQITRLVLVNDTAYISPKCQIEFLSSFFAQNEYTCLFKHYQGVVHASSNLIQITPRNTDFHSFFNFWRKYYPHNSRLKVVFKGEHELSKKIGIENLRPATEKLSLLPCDFMPIERNQLSTWIKRSNPELLSTLEFQDYQKEESDEIITNFAFENSQVSNALGLYLARKYHFPLKLDLPYYLLASKSSMVEVLKKGECNDIELEAIGQILESKGTISIGTPLQRLFKSFGLQA